MTAKCLLPIGALLLNACATVTNETRQPIIVGGQEYELRTRTIETGSGSYQTTDAMVNGSANTCIIDSPGDCEAAVRRGLSRFEDR